MIRIDLKKSAIHSQQNRGLFATLTALCVLVLLLMIGMGYSIYQLERISNEKKQALIELDDTKTNLNDSQDELTSAKDDLENLKFAVIQEHYGYDNRAEAFSTIDVCGKPIILGYDDMVKQMSTPNSDYSKQNRCVKNLKEIYIEHYIQQYN